MLPPHLGQPDVCSRCGQERPSSELIYEGEELSAVCLTCLRQLDPIRAQILERIQGQRQGPK